MAHEEEGVVGGVRESGGGGGLLCQLSNKLIGFAPVPTSYLISLRIFTGINRFYITASGAHRKVGRSYIMLILLGAVAAIHYIRICRRAQRPLA